MAARLTDTRVLEAVALLFEASTEARRLAQMQLDQADRLHRVASALHDLAIDETTLRVVS